MLKHRKYSFVFFFIIIIFGFALANAQTGNIPRIISYQGQITKSNEILLNGKHDIKVVLYSDPRGKLMIWSAKYSEEIQNGNFTILLGTGKNKLPGNDSLNQELWIGISIDGADEMKPLTQLTSVPYALNVPDKSITSSKLADDVLFGLGNLPKPTSTVIDWIVGGNTLGGDNFIGSLDSFAVEIRLDDNSSFLTSGTHRVMRYEPNDISANIIGGNFTNSVIGSGHVISGGGSNGHSNTITLRTGVDTVNFSTISGGSENIITGNFGVISGGNQNICGDGNYAVVSGGLQDTAESEGGVIAGGENNRINGTYNVISGGSNNQSIGLYTVVSGGIYNFIEAPGSVIGGGEHNSIFGTWSDGCVISGGEHNTIRKISQYVTGGTISGGLSNYVSDDLGTVSGGFKDTAKGAGSFIGGGYSNIAEGQASTIGGGGSQFGSLGNRTHGGWSVVAGGACNLAYGLSSVVSGGADNAALSSFSVVCGGIFDSVFNEYSVISDGEGNKVYGDHSGILSGLSNILYSNNSTISGGILNFDTSRTSSVIIGGESNIISAFGADHSTILGGMNNAVNDDMATFSLLGGLSDTIRSANSVIVGGELNLISANGADHTSILGGMLNVIDNNNAKFSIISGGLSDTIRSANSSIVGGEDNKVMASNADHSSIVGGKSNLINHNNAKFAFVGGGLLDTVSSSNSSILGGESNAISSGADHSNICGGAKNKIMSSFSNIPGGDSLTAQSYAQTIIGHNNFPQGTSTKSTIIGTDRLFIIGNGVPPQGEALGTQSNAFEVSSNGHSIVFDTNKLTMTPTISKPAIKGARYIDNTPIAWGRMDDLGNLKDAFGVDANPARTKKTAGGQYRIVLDYIDPYTASQITLPKGSSVVATIAIDENGNNYVCSMINATPLTTATYGGVVHSQFFIRICKNALSGSTLNCVADEQPFTFVVFARP